jgi:hypothetical protein
MLMVEGCEKPSVFEWHKMFKESCENVEDDERYDQKISLKTDENIGKVRNLVH